MKDADRLDELERRMRLMESRLINLVNLTVDPKLAHIVNLIVDERLGVKRAAGDVDATLQGCCVPVIRDS